METSLETQSLALVVTALESLSKSVSGLTTLVDRSLSEHDRAIISLSNSIADLDDATPSRAAFEELHNRVDNIEKGMSR